MVFGQKDGEIDRKSACKRQEAICIVLPQDFTIKRIDPPKPPKNAKIKKPWIGKSCRFSAHQTVKFNQTNLFKIPPLILAFLAFLADNN